MAAKPKTNLVDIPGQEATIVKDPNKKKQKKAVETKRQKNKKQYAKIRKQELEIIKSGSTNTKPIEGEVVNAVGRPTTYTPELAARICDGIADGKSLRTVCRDEQMPAASTVFLWLQKHREFSEQYTRATEERTEAMAEDLLDIADDGSNDFMDITLPGGYEKTVVDREAIERSKLRVETRKWMMSKMKPKKYGDKIDVTSGGEKIPAPLLGGASVMPELIEAAKQNNEQG